MRFVEINVYGLVQGVGFRFFVERLADKFGVLGWVMNSPDGSVKIHANIDENIFDEFIKLLREGSAFSAIKNIEVINRNDSQKYNKFEVKTHYDPR